MLVKQMGQTNIRRRKGIIGLFQHWPRKLLRKGWPNAICPGYINTGNGCRSSGEGASIIATIPVGRLGKAEEIAAMGSIPGQR